MLAMEPIGYIRTGKHLKFAALHQPEESAEETHVLEMVPGRGYEDGLRDLAGFTRIWLLWWFHKNTSWRPMVLPPRGPAIRRGVFATRSPHRPNPLGITPVQLRRIDRLLLHLGPCDLVEGTPIFDIKPYIPAYDSFPNEKAGWIDSLDAALAAPPAFLVSLSPLAHAQALWLRHTWNIDFQPRLTQLLSRDPSPHRTRRIKRTPDGQLAISCGAWRATFALHNASVQVLRLEPGFPLRFLHRPGREAVPDLAAQLAFLARWPETPSDPPPPLPADAPQMVEESPNRPT